jgi:hypothetical protein
MTGPLDSSCLAAEKEAAVWEIEIGIKAFPRISVASRNTVKGHFS